MTFRKLNDFMWLNSLQKAAKKAKAELTSQGCLKYISESKPFYVEVGTNGIGIGAT